jgi:hypothetical protein
VAVRWWLRGICVGVVLAMVHAAPAAADSAPVRWAKAGEAHTASTMSHVGHFLDRRGHAAAASVGRFWHKVTNRVARLRRRS